VTLNGKEASYPDSSTDRLPLAPAGMVIAYQTPPPSVNPVVDAEESATTSSAVALKVAAEHAG
jgi:hypothetical protein